MWFSTAVDVISIDRPIGNLGGVVQPKCWGLNGIPEQMVLHGQVNSSSSRFWSDGREHTFEKWEPLDILSLDVREISNDDLGWVFKNSA